MNVIPPITIRAAQLTSSTLAYPDTGETAWSSASVAYVVGDTVTYEVSGLVQKFRSITAHTSSATNYPVPYPNETVNWLDIGAANRYNMFHLERNTQSEGTSPLVVEVTPGERFGAVGFGNLECDSIRVEVYDGATQIHDESQDTVSRQVTGWWDYFYQPFRQIENAVFWDLPILSTAKIKVTFTRGSGNVKVGFFVLGMPFEIGTTSERAEADALNFSEIARDEFGESRITPRRDVPKTSQIVLIDSANIDNVRGLLKDLNAQVALWSALSDPLNEYFGSLFIIGLYKRRNITVNDDGATYLSLELEQV